MGTRGVLEKRLGTMHVKVANSSPVNYISEFSNQESISKI